MAIQVTQRTRVVTSAVRSAIGRLLCLLVLMLLAGLPAMAQTATTPAPPAQRLDQARAQLDQLERTLGRTDLNDAALANLRAELDPIGTMAQGVVDELTPQFAGVKARLDQLGPKPDAKAAPESAQIGAERDEQTKKLDDLDAVLKRARLVVVQIGQDSDAIAARRRTQFASALFARSNSILSPPLWMSVLREAPSDVAATVQVVHDWGSRAAGRLGGWTTASFLLALAAVALVTVVVARAARRILSREPHETDPTRLRKVLAAVWVTGVTAIVPIAAIYALLGILAGFDLTSDRVEPVIAAIASGVVRLSLTAGLARGLLAPKRPTWRLLDLSTPMTERLTRLAVSIATIITVSKILEAIGAMIVASLAAVVAVRGVGALAVGLVMLAALKGILPEPDPTDDCLGPIVTTTRDWYGPLRLIAWAVLSLILAAVLVGYIAFAAFLVDQLAWVSFVATVAYLLAVLANDGFAAVLRPQARVGRAVLTSIGVRRESLEQVATLGAGIATLVLIVVALLLVLAPWGVGSDDMLGSLRAAFFGFKVGEVTVSLSDIAVALALFAFGLALTRALQRWLDTRYLPLTHLDQGLRNSIRTSLGYVGFVLAASLALANVGLSFDKIAIVAGALSVGIGFGLQSIVNNFVSGLIILWERTIRVGDWVVIGPDQGIVRRINVRSTEIETFERSTMIVPNSTLVSGTVTNRVRGDRTARVKITLAVGIDADPEKARDILLDCALSEPLVAKTPKPSVLFTEISDSKLIFDLICFVSEIDTQGRAKSALNFTIVRRFKEAGLVAAAPPMPESRVHVADLDRLADLLAHRQA